MRERRKGEGLGKGRGDGGDGRGGGQVACAGAERIEGRGGEEGGAIGKREGE